MPEKWKGALRARSNPFQQFSVEIIAGIIVFSRWTKIGSYIVGAWLIAIAINLVTTGIFHDLAMRDV